MQIIYVSSMLHSNIYLYSQVYVAFRRNKANKSAAVKKRLEHKVQVYLTISIYNEVMTLISLFYAAIYSCY